MGPARRRGVNHRGAGAERSAAHSRGGADLRLSRIPLRDSEAAAQSDHAAPRHAAHPERGRVRRLRSIAPPLTRSGAARHIAPQQRPKRPGPELSETVMPLSPPRPREHLHTRNIECHGYRRDDGLWDIEGHIVDTKSYDFPNEARGEIKSGTPVHDIWIRLTIAGEYRIHDVEAVTDAGAYRGCGGIASDFV